MNMNKETGKKKMTILDYIDQRNERMQNIRAAADLEAMKIELAQFVADRIVADRIVADRMEMTDEQE